MRRLCPYSCGGCGGAVASAARAAKLEAHEADELDLELERRSGGGGAGGADAAGGPTLHGLMAHWCGRVRAPGGTAAGAAAGAPGGTAAGAVAGAASSSVLPMARVALPMALRTVRLVPGSEFFDAQQLNTDYLLSLSVARLLVSFYVTAGLAPPHKGEGAAAQPYGGWEDAAGGYPDPSTPTRTLRGHFVGHYLSALAMAYAGGGTLSVLERGRELLAGMGECQRAAGTGFLSAWPSRVLDTLEAGQFGDVWAPWYTLHKILAGLLDWHAHAELQP